jgi:hypothetical protein
MTKTSTIRPLSALFIVAVASASLAACGPPATPTTPPAPTGEPSAEPAPTDAPKGEPAGSGAKPDGDHGHGHGLTESVAIGPSSLLAEASKIVDMKKPVPLSKMKMGKKKKLMPLFQKALGFKDCSGCHAGGDKIDFKQETKNIKMARAMWDNYVVGLRDEKGGALFCDSCHQGKEHLLARDDKDALNKFMSTNYEGKLTRADGEDHGCGTCHGDAFETKIFEKMWNIK